jgi:transcriptional regulator with XRE-family HTH domain
MTVREQLAKNLALYRKKAGFTQKSAADELGTKLTTISSWERGVSQPSADMLVTIAMTYRVSLSDLCGMDYKQTFTPAEKELIQAFREHPEHQASIRVLLGLDPVSQDMGRGGKIGQRRKLNA